MGKYAQRMLELTADTEVEENHNKLGKKSKKILSPLGIQFGGCTDEDKDCMCQDNNIFYAPLLP